MKMTKLRSKQGQTIVEYVIIVAIVAIAAIAIIGLFSDTLRNKFGGAIVELGGDQDAADDALDEKSVDKLQDLGDQFED